MNLPNATRVALCTTIALSPTFARAAVNDYKAPTLKTRGAASTPIAGAGTVIVKVFVKRDGGPTSFDVVRSTNHGDDAAALEIARSSTYKSALRAGTPLDAFYDFTLKFTASGSASTLDPAAKTGVGKYKLMIGAGNYTGAEAGLKAYLASHPADAAAELQLGIAEQYLNDPVAASGAFDKAGTVPANYAALAARAYSDAASSAFKSKDYPASVGFAKKAVAIAPGATTENTLGTAETSAGEFDAAIADLEQARKLAAADAKFKPSDRATIDGNLVSAYLGAGKIEQAQSVAAEAAKLDPNATSAQAFLAQYYVKSANDAQAKQDFGSAATALEQAATLAPNAQRPNLYAQAALAYLKIKDKTPNDKAKADADKALAIAPDNALANFAAGIALANQPGKSKDALVYLNKADVSAKTANDASLTTSIEAIIKQVNGLK